MIQYPNVTATVSLAGGGTLALEQPGIYEVVSFGAGGRRWRRTIVEGRFQHGRAILNAALEQSESVLRERVLGATWVEVSNRAQALVDAFSQLTYTLTVTIDDVTFTFACEPANVAVAGSGTWDKAAIAACMQEYEITIPRSPVPLSGPL